MQDLNSRNQDANSQMSVPYVLTVDRIYNNAQVEAFIEEIKCPICYNILVDPQICSKCEKCFCKGCFASWLKMSKKSQCPCCRQVISNPGSSIVPKLLVALLHKLEFRCKNKNQGCPKIINYEFLEHHENKDCNYHIVPCINSTCKSIIYKQDLATHLETCLFVTKACQFCGIYMSRPSLIQHISNYCPKKIVSCEQCSSEMEYRTFQTHRCQSQQKRCSKCNIIFSREEYEIHTQKCKDQQKKNQDQKQPRTNSEQISILL